MRVSTAFLLAASLAAGGLAGCTQPTPPPQVAGPPKAPAPQPPTQNAPMCVKPAEKTGFELTTLTSHMKVIAIQCQEVDRYNAYVGKFRPDLIGADKAVTGYFSRAYGRRARAEQDDYDTQLFNAASQFAIRHGTLFCQQNVGMVGDVLALGNGAPLVSYVENKPLQQALAVEDCPATPVPAAKPVAAKPAAKPATKPAAKP